MQALSNLNSTFRGRELQTAVIDTHNCESRWNTEHTEVFCGVEVSIRRKIEGGHFALFLKLRNGEVLTYMQNDDIALDPKHGHSTLAAATWIYENRYLPLIRLCSLGWADLIPASVEEFQFVCTLISNNFLPGECRVDDLVAGMHEMIDALQKQGLLIEVSEETSMLRQAVGNFQEQFEDMERCGRLTAEQNAMLDQLRLQGHAVMVIQRSDLGCARRDMVESTMIYHGESYLKKHSKRAA